MFDTLFAVAKEVLKRSDEATVELISHRLAGQAADQQWCDALFEIDEATEVLDMHDHQEVKNEKKNAEREVSAHHTFKAEYTAKKKEVDAAKPKPPAKKKAKKGPVAAGPKPKLPSTIPQSSAKLWIPEATSIWRDLTRGGWCGHCPPYKRISQSWHLLWEEGAMKAVIEQLWQQALELKGLDHSECPYDGMF